MKTGFLIVNYNDYETTKHLLDNIKEYLVLDKIVVVDNCSSDDSYKQLLKYYQNDHIQIVKNTSNKGYASGINVGSKYLIEVLGNCNILVSNSDIEIYREKDIETLVDSKDDDCAILAPIIKEHTGYNRGWKIPSPMQDAILNIFYIHRFLRPKMLFYKDSYFKKELVEVEAVSGCFFLIDSRYLQKVDYFDENTFLYYEENIIAKKLQKINKKIMINTKVEVFHNHSVSIDKNINHLNKYKELKKSQYYFQKEYNGANWISRGLLKIVDKITFLLLYMIKKIEINKYCFHPKLAKKRKHVILYKIIIFKKLEDYMNSNNAIEVRNLGKYFKVAFDKPNTLKERIVGFGKNKTEHREILKDISLDIKKGETVALIGTNGCGKSTLLKLMTKILYPNEGTLETTGKLTSLLELGAGFHPDFTGRENIYFNAAIFGLTRNEIDKRINEIIDFSELSEFIDNPIRTYSSGMYMRLAFSIAINVDAEILLIDEILGVGDQHFQEKCFDKLMKLKESDKTIVIVSHSLDTVKKLCERAIWIYKGELKLDGDPSYVIKKYLDQVILDHQEKRMNKKTSSQKKKVADFKGVINIDGPQPFSNVGGEKLLIYGWGLCDDDAKIEVFVDDAKQPKVSRVARPDVLLVYEEQYGGYETNDLAGWEVSISLGNLSVGEHMICVQLVDQNQKKVCQREVNFTLKKED